MRSVAQMLWSLSLLHYTLASTERSAIATSWEPASDREPWPRAPEAAGDCGREADDIVSKRP